MSEPTVRPGVLWVNARAIRAAIVNEHERLATGEIAHAYAELVADDDERMGAAHRAADAIAGHLLELLTPDDEAP
jgi:hypothetical protein